MINIVGDILYTGVGRGKMSKQRMGKKKTRNKEQERTGRIPKKSDVMKNKFQRKTFSVAKV